jgi:curli biogenesis system outer membrane secretion channel CsgG
MNTHLSLIWSARLLAIALAAGSAAAQADDSAGVQAVAPAASAPKKLPRTAGEPVAVAIYEFRSSVGELAARGSTDMFITALMHNGGFRVVERSQLEQGLMQEKQLNAQGLTTGTVAQKQLRGAQYIFEGTISEANAAESERSGGIGLAGVTVTGDKSHDTIAIDVRIVDAATGDILDAVTLRRSVKSDAASVSGVGNFLRAAMERRGVNSAYVPDVEVAQQRKQSLDKALRGMIEDAVAQVASRF